MNTQNATQILGTAHYLPSQQISSSSLDKKLGLPQGQVEKLSGVIHRHFAHSTESAASMGANAARAAMASAQLNFDQIDCVICANGTQDQGMPSNAALLHQALNLHTLGIPAFDINASCLSFIVALDTASSLIAAGRYERILIVSSDIASVGLDWRHLEGSTIFGDGAAAAVVGKAPHDSPSRVRLARLTTLSQGAGLCQIPAGGSRFHPSRVQTGFTDLTLFQMDGKAIYKLAASYIQHFVDQLMADAGLSKNRINWVIPHQASQLALEHLIKRSGFSPQQVVTIFPTFGNQVAASVPTTLDCAIRDGRVQRGDTVLLIGTGAGLNIGGLILTY